MHTPVPLNQQPGCKGRRSVQHLTVLQLMFLKYYQGNTCVVAHYYHSVIQLLYYFINPPVYLFLTSMHTQLRII